MNLKDTLKTIENLNIEITDDTVVIVAAPDVAKKLRDDIDTTTVAVYSLFGDIDAYVEVIDDPHMSPYRENEPAHVRMSVEEKIDELKELFEDLTVDNFAMIQGNNEYRRPGFKGADLRVYPPGKEPAKLASEIHHVFQDKDGVWTYVFNTNKLELHDKVLLDFVSS